MDNYSGTVNLGEGERGRSSSNLVCELRLPGMGGLMLLSSTSPEKQQSEMEVEVEVEVEDYRSGGSLRGPTKIARTDAGYAPFVCREQKLQIQMGSGSGSVHHLPVLHNRSGSDNSSACLVSEGRPRPRPALAPSSSNSYASSTERTILNNDGSSSSTVSSESMLLRRSNDSVLSATDATTARPSLPFYKPPTGGMPAVSSMQAMGTTTETGVMEMHGVRAAGVRPPFSPAQWQELEHQALIFKYMMACVPVPRELIIPIRKSLISLPHGSPSTLPLSHQHLSNLTPWSSFHMGFGGNMDLEPGRCRRTDGKKWRCSRDVVPDQKYCERHMHRGRHRSRKPVEGHTAAVNSQSNSSNSALAPSSLSLAGVVTSTSNFLACPSISFNSLQKLHQPGPLLGTKNLPFTGSGSQFQHYPLQSAAAASAPSAAVGHKDYRYVDGTKGGEMDDHILFSEASGSSTMNSEWRFMLASKPAVPHIPQSKTNSDEDVLQYSSSPQLRTLLGQNHGIVRERNQVASIDINPHDKQQQQRQQHLFLGTDYERVQRAMRDPEEQPLRHFFDEWPRSRDPWATDVEGEMPNCISSTTQLSISIPMPSSNFSATNSSSSPRGKLSLTSLKLSMSRDGSDQLDVDPIEMGLAVGMNMNVEERRRQTQSQHHHNHHQANWFPITWENPMGMGGPLAEVLQSSTTPSGCNNNKPGLNLMNDIGWKDNMNSNSISIISKKISTSSHLRDSPTSCMQASSPTGVLQKTFGFVSGTSRTSTSKTET